MSELLFGCEARLGHPGWARDALAALRAARQSSMPQVGPEFELPGRTARKARLVMSPLIGVAQLSRGVSLCFEEVGELSLQLEQLQRDWHVRVRERTAELEHVNDRLLREIADHMRTGKQLALAQEQLSHAQRLEAVGRLAGGIAHDFNNMLSVVLGYSLSMIETLPESSTMRADLEEIKRAGERATELTRQLLAFGRQQVLNPKVLDLNEVISEVERMLSRVLGEDIELVTKLTSPLWKVKVDRGQIEQVLTNLMVNARDAMPQGGKLTIESAHAVFDESYVREHPGAATGPHVVLAVSDTGSGMDKQTQARAFEPFFTTKEQGKGSGLGLATVFGTVKQSGGHIWLYSELERGTTFKLCFPRCDGFPELKDGSVSTPRASLPRGNETILLVEDDPQLRALARNILLRQGYQVLDAGEPGSALKICESFAGTIDLLLTDVVMPRMSGRELADRFLQLRPHTRVLFMSGYTDNAIVHHGILDPSVEFMQKPITPDSLTRRVRGVLDA
ncbi:MAG TPA: ATP-binding protein [Polyangiales bacterium]|nr:ATP-binding protein [Polyangiales bacterium]